MQVGIFYNSISNPAKFSNKVMLMDNFKAGVIANGDVVIEYQGNQLPDRPLAAGFVLGYTLEDNFRRKIINCLRNQNTPQVFVDSNILHYARPGIHEWHRYSLNSVYPNDGVYFFDAVNPDKWQTYSQWHGINSKSWRTGGKHILVLAQRPKGWNMFGKDQDQWLETVINQLKQYTDRPIRVRMHPGDGSRDKQIDKLIKRGGVAISSASNIQEDLIDCWTTVGYNSTPNVVAAIEGIPCYIADPVHSWAKDIAYTDLSQMENPPMPDRTEWLNKIANIHWSNSEVKSGLLWESIKKYISSVQQ
jgi:hypothetical protein